MGVIDANLGVEQHRIGPGIVEGKQRSWRRLPKADRRLKNERGNQKKRSGADRPEAGRIASIRFIGLGIERLRLGVGEFVRQSFLKTGGVRRRHGVPGEAIPVAPGSQLELRFRFSILRKQKLCAAADVSKSLGEKGEVRGEIAACHPEARSLDVPPWIAPWIECLSQ